MIKYILFFILILTSYSNTYATPNKEISSLQVAQNILMKIYQENAVTFYCRVPFNRQKQIQLPKGFLTPKYKNRANKMEWEHIVPVENFGKLFKEWNAGDSTCINHSKKYYKGRKCVLKTSLEFRFMISDMYNLVPAIGMVNAMRSNYNFSELEKNTPNAFGICDMKFQKNLVQPPVYTRGEIARIYLYFEKAYPRFKISKKMRPLLMIWDKKYPVTKWECKRAKIIEQIQKNKNEILTERCQSTFLTQE